MNKTAKRVHPIKGIVIGLTSSDSEINRLLRFRQTRLLPDRIRATNNSRRLRNVLCVYDLIRSRPDEWATLSDVEAVTGYCRRQCRRLMATFMAARHPQIEVQYGTRDSLSRSRIRYVSSKT